MVLCPLAPCGLPELNARAIHLLNPPLMDPTRGRPCIGGNAWEDVAAIAIDCPHARRMQQRGLHLWLFEKPMPTGNACQRTYRLGRCIEVRTHAPRHSIAVYANHSAHTHCNAYLHSDQPSDGKLFVHVLFSHSACLSNGSRQQQCDALTADAAGSTVRGTGEAADDLRALLLKPWRGQAAGLR